MKPLLAVDESHPSEAVIGIASRFQVPEDTVATLLTVLEPAPPLATGMQRWEIVHEERRARRAAATAFLEREAGRLAAVGIDARISVVEGHPAERIIWAAHDGESDLIVIGSHGRGALGRLVLGGVSHRVVLHADCSVLVGRTRERSDGEPDPVTTTPPPVKILATLDDSEASWGALRRAAAISWRGGTEVTIFRVHDTSEPADEASRQRLTQAANASLQRAADLFAGPDVKVNTELRFARPAHAEILAAAAGLGVDLIVVGDKGRSAIRRFLIGSVTQHVLQEASCSVLVGRSAESSQR